MRDTIYTSGDWKYEKYSNGTVGIVRYIGEDQEVSVPDTIDGMTVTQIKAKAFYGHGIVEKITIPNTVTSIG